MNASRTILFSLLLSLLVSAVACEEGESDTDLQVSMSDSPEGEQARYGTASLESFREAGEGPDIADMSEIEFAAVEAGEEVIAFDPSSLAVDDSVTAYRQEAPVYENPFLMTDDAPLSSFGIDVDGASYTNVRNYLNSDLTPPAHIVRIEELVNYFDYGYPAPGPGAQHPFLFNTEVAPCPWNPAHRLVRIGLKGTEVPKSALPPANFVFLADVSGSMDQPDKLPLLKESLLRLVERLRPVDRVAIVTYAGNSGLVLPSTPGSKKGEIRQAIERMSAGGSTAGASGIRLAYDVARKNFRPEGNNRVILATDGDFNVGVSSRDELIRLIEGERDDGIYLSVLGFGFGMYSDVEMEALADNGNGNYYFIDGAREAERVFGEEMSGTLLTIATDVKIQVGFNPSKVNAYRLIGYENRALTTAEFNDDRKDAGDLGAGTSVTAFYEIVPAGTMMPATGRRTPGADDRREMMSLGPDDLMGLRLRYKIPGSTTSRLLEHEVTDADARVPSAAFLFGSAVAEWGLLLRNSQYAPHASMAGLYSRARRGAGFMPDQWKSEFLGLIRTGMAGVPKESDHRLR